MTTDELIRKAYEAIQESREARERLALIRKQALIRINKQLAKLADKKTIISFEEDSE